MTVNDETIVIEAPQEVAEIETALPIENETIEPEEEKVPKGVQKRIDAITKEKYEERRERQAAQERADRLEQELSEYRNSSKQPQAQPPKVLQDGAPDPDSFPAGRYDPDYLEALTDYKVNQIFSNQQKNDIIATKQRDVITMQAQAREQYTDYDATEAEFFQHPLTTVPAFRELLLESDNPAELSYFLGKNPEEMDKLGEMTPAQATRYIGRLEAQIVPIKSVEQPKKAASTAPRPIAPLGSAKTSNVITDPADAQSMADYVKLRETQRK